MGEYLSPGVYVEDNPGLPVIEAVSSSTGGFMGVTQRGPVNKPVFITSWNAFLTNFALGCDSPFLKDSYLAYSIYGFFQNGGKRCYVMRVAGTGYTCATAQYSETPDGESNSVLKFTISAKDEGTWANGFKVYVKANEDDATLFDIVTLDGSGNVVEVVDAKKLEYNGYHFYLSHYPTFTANLEKESLKKCIINLYGHTHQKSNFYNDIPFMYHVGVDSHNCTPVLLDDVIAECEAKVMECKKQL